MSLRGGRTSGRRAAATFLLLACATPGCRSVRPADHVLLVTLDTTRADRQGCYGYADAETHTLDGLAAEATLFEQAVAPAPVTLPSHCTMFTGLNPYRHGVRYNALTPLADSQTTLAERLSRAGFQTGAVPSAFPVSERFGVAQGFDSYDDLFAGKPASELRPDVQRRAAEAVDLGLQWWNEHRDGRRFLWLHLFDAHYEYDPPFPYSVRFRERPYQGEIAYADHELERLFQALKNAGDWDRTLVIVAGDHGEGLYEHGERWHSNQVYESTLHVPLVIKAPDQRKARRVAQPVGLVDIAPTVLDYVGLPVPRELEGISLRHPVGTGRAPLRPIYFEAMGGSIHFGWSPLLGLRAGTYKYFEGGKAELYDLAVDRGELDNLAPRQTERVGELAAELDFFRRQAEEVPAGEELVLDDEALAQLASLGYVGGASGGSMQTGQGAHPPEMVDLEQELLRAQTLVALRKWEEAAESLDFLLQRDPTNRFALTYRARSHAQASELAEALTLAEALVRIYPDSADAHDLHGELLSRAGRPGEAAEVYARAVAEHPEHHRLRYHRVLALMEAGRPAEAEQEVAVLEQQRPEHYATWVGRAMVEAAQGRQQTSLGAIGRAIDLGLKNLKPFDESPVFAEVRGRAEYAALKERVEKSEGAGVAKASGERS